MKEVTFDFNGKNFVVVGASSGMGRQTAIELSKAGANVLAIARNKDRLLDLEREGNLNIQTAVLDVVKATPEEWNKVLLDFVSKYGKIHGGVYTAGISAATPLRMFDRETARAIMDTSFWGMIDFMQCASKKRIAEQRSSYVVFSSVAAYTGTKGLMVYAGAKAAVHATVKSISKEIGRSGHCINSISPSWVDTKMTNDYITSTGISDDYVKNGCLGMGKPENVVGMVLFLLSDKGKWITGTDIVVDGGYLLGGND